MPALSGWKPYNDHVQTGMLDGRFMSAAFTMLAAGPPRLASMNPGTAALSQISDELANQLGGKAAKELALPIGVVQNFNLSHNKQFSRFWEVGSERSYFIAGRTMGQLGLSRIMYHGPSLLRMLTAYYQDTFPDTIVPPLFANPAIQGVANKHDVQIPPGYRNVFLNLASDLFSQPVGLMMMFRDSNLSTMAAAYLESCFIPSHTLASDSQGVVIQESAQIQFERAVPIDVDAVALIRGVPADLVPGNALASGQLPSGGAGSTIADSGLLVG